MNFQAGLPDFILTDLAQSGLVPEDVNARPIDNPERAVTMTPYSTNGYVLPYFDINGRIRPFYRVRLFESDTKYRQPKDSPNHVYFPKTFLGCLLNKNYVIITEGEKKAAAACKAGFPCAALGGVDSWRNRTILISGDAQLTQRSSKLAVRLPQEAEVVEDYDAPLALGLIELIDLVVSQKLQVVIVYDSDNVSRPPFVKGEVQRAATTFGYELRYRGVPFQAVRQLILPPMLDFAFTGEKVGLDDYLVNRGSAAFGVLLGDCLARRGAFPCHPNVRDYINRRLQGAKIPRKELQHVAMAILSDLDSRGLRLRGITNETYFFDHPSKTLLRAEWANTSDILVDSPFTQFLYKEYGLSGADSRVINWLGIQFTSEAPIDNVTPHRILAVPDENKDEVCFQLSDSHYAKVDADGLTIHQNGANNILFVSDQCEPLDPELVKKEYARQQDGGGSLPCWWASTLSQVRLRDKDKQRVVAALLYYMSPWLFRWRGMQLPVELIVGESGSGKSTLCELRLDILTGRPLLRNTPTDLRDWHASVTNSGGLHILDNVQLVDRTLRQRLSDEICRIVTEPDPFIEQRKYYTNADLIRIPVRTVFALTAIQQPFQNADLLQRAFILELDKSIEATPTGEIRYDSKWKGNQLQGRGGREAWVAHHLLVLNRFFALVRKEWQPEYQAKQRLINFEQAMLFMAKVFEIPSSWIPTFLTTSSERATSEADWILEGLHAFALEHQRAEFLTKRFTAGAIAEWAQGEEEYRGCEMLINTRKLGRYIRSHKSGVFTLTGIQECGLLNNRIMYQLRGKPLPRREY